MYIRVSGLDDLFFCEHEKIVRLGKVCVHFVHADNVQVYSELVYNEGIHQFIMIHVAHSK